MVDPRGPYQAAEDICREARDGILAFVLDESVVCSGELEKLRQAYFAADRDCEAARLKVVEWNESRRNECQSTRPA